MPKIMALGNCTCKDWADHAQNISDRIVSSTATGMNIYEGPMFGFCPYCGRKLLQAGAGHKDIGTWRGKPLQECDHQELVEIIQIMGDGLNEIQKGLVENINLMLESLGE